MRHTSSEKSEMSDLTWASDMLRSHVAPPGSAQYEAKVSLREWIEPLPFDCAICQRTIRADRWRSHITHKPPICYSCANSRGHQVRVPGMTRGDHHTLQRLTAITDALLSAASMREFYARHPALRDVAAR